MEDNNTSCKLKIPNDLIGKTPVFLVNFNNGCVNLNKSEKLKFQCYQQGANENSGSRIRRVLCATNDRLKFKNSILNDDYCRNRFQYCVGVRKKNSNKMKVYESATFHLKPIRNPCHTSVTTETKNIREKLDDLTLSFGSKGKKRSINARQKYSTDTSQLDDTLEDLHLDNSQSKTNYTSPGNNASANIEYIPPQNQNAQFVNEVYDIKDIIPTEVDEYLTERAGELLQDIPTHLNRWRTDSTFCEYILKHMEVNVDITKMKYLLFYNFIVKFSGLLSSDIRKKDPIPEIPEPVKSYLLETFTVSSVTEHGKTVRAFPIKMKDKLLAYMIVIALFIDDFVINLALLQTGTKYGMPKISNVAQAIGCYVNRRKIENSSIPFAELKLPLNSLKRYYKKS